MRQDQTENIWIACLCQYPLELFTLVTVLFLIYFFDLIQHREKTECWDFLRVQESFGLFSNICEKKDRYNTQVCVLKRGQI